jgi:hypothetical protein
VSPERLPIRATDVNDPLRRSVLTWTTLGELVSHTRRRSTPGPPLSYREFVDPADELLERWQFGWARGGGGAVVLVKVPRPAEVSAYLASV